jgi:hypothetical protein
MIITLLKLKLLLQSWKVINSQDSDWIQAELIQAGGEILHSEIHNLINSIWNKEEWTDRWKEPIIVRIQKEGQ